MYSDMYVSPLSVTTHYLPPALEHSKMEYDSLVKKITYGLFSVALAMTAVGCSSGGGKVEYDLGEASISLKVPAGWNVVEMNDDKLGTSLFLTPDEISPEDTIKKVDKLTGSGWKAGDVFRGVLIGPYECKSVPKPTSRSKELEGHGMSWVTSPPEAVEKWSNGYSYYMELGGGAGSKGSGSDCKAVLVSSMEVGKKESDITGDFEQVATDIITGKTAKITA